VDQELKSGRGARIALLCGISAIVLGLALVLATVHPAIPFLAGGAVLLAVGVVTWRLRVPGPRDGR
jgi:hypothetical protein